MSASRFKEQETADSRSATARAVGRTRPRERVLAYLQAEFSRGDLKEGTRLPTVRELSSQLKVSVFTVQQVLAHLAKEGRIRTRVGSGTFLVTPGARKDETLRIGLFKPAQWAYQKTRTWSAEVYNGILQASFHARRPCEVVPIPVSEDPSANDDQRLLADSERANGLILFSSPLFKSFRALCERTGKLIVNVNPPSVTTTANFVSFDFHASGLVLGNAWRTTGRTKILLLLAVAGEPSVSDAMRRLGLETGLGCKEGSGVSLRVVEIADASVEAGHRAIRPWLADRATAPDAIYCAGDFLALGVVQAARECGLRVPEDLSIVGGSGLDLSQTSTPNLTRTRVSFEEMGKELVGMLEQRLEKGGVSVPGRYLPVSFAGGATTRPEENMLLGLGSDRGAS